MFDPLRNWQTASVAAVRFCVPTSSARVFQFLQILANTVVFHFKKIIAFLVGVEWYFIVVLICIFLWLMIYLLAIWIPFLGKCLLKFLAYFKIWLYCILLLNFRVSLYTNIDLLSDVWFINIFSYLVGFLFPVSRLFLDIICWYIRLLILKSFIYCFIFCCLCFWCRVHEIISKLNVINVFPCPLFLKTIIF